MIQNTKRYVGVLFLMLVHALGAAALNLPAKVRVEILSNYQSETITGQISIAHLAGQQIEPATFQMEGKALLVELIGEDYPAGIAANDQETLVVTKYRFTLPGKPRGLYVLPEIQVKVGDAVVAAPQVTFEVLGAQISDELQLNARIQEKGPYYPGQKVTFQYLISFRNPIQLTKERLPLLEFKGFRTIGAPKIENLPQGANTVQIISQKAVALEPGTFTSGVSIIEGYVYGIDVYGNRVTSPSPVQAQAPSLEVKVVPFPSEGMPISFNGALGNFYWRVRPVGSVNVATGEKITLEVTVTGSGDFDTVNFPDLSKQKGFKEAFRLSDIPPIGELKESSKVFMIELRPIIVGLKAVPAIEFSSFDPFSQVYVSKKSDPIAITVRKGLKAAKEESISGDMPPPVWPIDIRGNVALDESTSQASHLQTILLVIAALLLAAILGAQYLFQRMYLENTKKKAESRDLILEAIKQKLNPDDSCKLLRLSLLLRLYEVGQTKELINHPEELSKDGLQGEIRSLLLSIEEKRFMGLETQMEIKQIIDEASQLYYRLK